MKTIVVTGGAGFIGANFVHFLTSKSLRYRVIVFDKLTYAGNLLSLEPALRKNQIQFVKGDIASSKQVEALYRRYKPTYLFNFAAESHVDRSIDGPGDFVKTNLVGTFELLQGARRFWKSISNKSKKEFRFLHVSTDEVYGSLGSKGLFTEKTPYSPNSPYSATKAGADHLVRAYFETYGMPVVMTNCSNNYGPYQFPEKLIPLIILNALEGVSLPIYGDGGNIRDWLYVEDHCEALWLVMTRGKLGGKYNVGGDSERTNLQVVKTICSWLDALLPAEKNQALLSRGIKVYENLITYVKDRPGHDRRYAINASKIRRELGWRPRHNFTSGMKNTVKWYLENLDWCEQVEAGKFGRRRLGLMKGKR